MAATALTPSDSRAEAGTANLLDLYEPLFQHICLLNRMSRKSAGEKKGYEAVRGSVAALLETIRQRAEADPVLAMQAGKLELPILFFIDSIISESKLECAAQWHRNRLAFARNQLAGDEKFFDMLDETLADSSREATERLKIYYVCMGLGFTGWYSTQPEYLRKKMETIAMRISAPQDRAAGRRLCPETYQYLDTRNLIEPPAGKIGMIVILFIGLCLMAAMTDFYLFRLGSEGFLQSLKEIERHELNK
jgi:type IV/VI secretion system ImpK/VasF family protein